MAELEAWWALSWPPYGQIFKADYVTSVFRSKQFVFVIGNETKTEYTVHRDLIAKQSKALNSLVNGEMQETLDGRATFEDLDDNTFVRFCQFAYTGDYTTPGLFPVQML